MSPSLFQSKGILGDCVSFVLCIMVGKKSVNTHIWNSKARQSIRRSETTTPATCMGALPRGEASHLKEHKPWPGKDVGREHVPPGAPSLLSGAPSPIGTSLLQDGSTGTLTMQFDTPWMGHTLRIDVSEPNGAPPDQSGAPKYS